MQISKFPLWVCAFAIGGVLSLQAEDTPAQAAAREALLKQMQGTDTNAFAVAPAAAPAATVSATQDTPAQAAARSALLKQMQEADTNPPVTTASVTNVPATAKPTATTNVYTAQPGMKPIVAPPLPISMSKEQKLQELLAKYKADQITAKQYQEQRAAILAEP